MLQISLSSDTLNEQQLYDYGYYTLRQRLAPIHGVTFPTPAGGKYRQIMVDPLIRFQRSRANLRSPSRSAVGGYPVAVKGEPIEET